MATQKKLFILLLYYSYNVNGILNPIKRSKTLGKMRKEGVEVALLQGTHLSQKEQTNGFNQIFSSSYATGRRRGVATVASGKITFEKLLEISDKKGKVYID